MKQFFSLFITIILTALYAHSQVKPGPPAVPETKPVDIIRGDKLRTEKIDSVREIQIGVGNFKARQGTTLFECDSFYYDKSTKIFEAFGNVHINDNDSINIYSKYLLYHVDTRIANLKNNVRLTDGKSTLTTQQLDYDLNQKIGNYYNGGKVLNEKSVLTSTEATYFANSKDVYFKKKVVLIDPQYELRSDSLLYNSQTQLTTFITKTYIKDSARNIVTSSGFYDLKNKKASFGKRPTINDGSSQVIADTIDTNDSTGISILTGNVFYKDTAQGYAMRGNFMHVNKKDGSLLATRNAVLIIKQDKDSLFVTGDTLISGKLSLLKLQVDSINKKNSSGRDSVSLKNDSIKSDSTKIAALKNASTINDSTKIVALKNDSTKSDPTKIVALKNDSTKSDSTINGLADRKNIALNKAVTDNKTDSIKSVAIIPNTDKEIADKKNAAKRNNDKLNTNKSNPSKSNNNKNIAAKNKAAENNKDSLRKQRPVSNKDTGAVIKGVVVVDTKSKNDSADRYFQAYHHVRIFSDSLQAVSDSLFYSGKDSIFKLFRDPVMWANNSQVSGDTIYIYTKNKKADRVYVFENGIAVNKAGTDMYNQLKGNRINGYFNDGVIDYMRAKGNAESIYYATDKDGYYVGINRVAGDIIDMRFKDKELNRVIVMNEVKGTMYPVKQMPDSEKHLRNFKWQEERRPKTKHELFEPPKPMPAPTRSTVTRTDF